MVALYGSPPQIFFFTIILSHSLLMRVVDLLEVSLMMSFSLFIMTCLNHGRRQTVGAVRTFETFGGTQGSGGDRSQNSVMKKVENGWVQNNIVTLSFHQLLHDMIHVQFVSDMITAHLSILTEDTTYREKRTYQSRRKE